MYAAAAKLRVMDPRRSVTTSTVRTGSAVLLYCQRVADQPPTRGWTAAPPGGAPSAAVARPGRRLGPTRGNRTRALRSGDWCFGLVGAYAVGYCLQPSTQDLAGFLPRSYLSDKSGNPLGDRCFG